MVAIEPDRSVGATVILRDAEGGHSIAGHASEAVPLSRHLAVTQGNARGLIHMEVCVPPRFVQADVGRTWVQH